MVLSNLFKNKNFLLFLKGDVCQINKYIKKDMCETIKH